MKKYIILTKKDLSEIEHSRPVLIDIDNFTYILCSEEYYENKISGICKLETHYKHVDRSEDSDSYNKGYKKGSRRCYGRIKRTFRLYFFA